MFRVQCKSLSTASVLLAALFLVSAVAFGQNDTQSASQASHAFNIGYFINTNSGLPDSQVHISNPGNTGAYGGTGTSIYGGDLCANIYVYTGTGHLSECCSCKVPPNGMLGLSLASNLTNNPVTGAATLAKNGTVKIVSSFGGGPQGAGLPPAPAATGSSGLACNAASNFYPFGQLESWITHVRTLGSSFGAAFDVTEIDFVPVGLSTSELVKLQQQCYAIVADPTKGGLGSGQGVCSCGSTF